MPVTAVGSWKNILLTMVNADVDVFVNVLKVANQAMRH
jgi:hypothetical protein